MSKLAKCDHCGKTADTETAELAWTHVEYQVNFPGFGCRADLCSWACVMEFAGDKATAERMQSDRGQQAKRGWRSR